MEKLFTRQNSDSGSTVSFAWQVVRLMTWPMCIVLLVIGILYLERMRSVEQEAALRGRLLLESASVLLNGEFRSIAFELAALTADLQGGDDNRLSQRLCKLASERSGYRRILLVDANGRVAAAYPSGDSNFKLSEGQEVAAVWDAPAFKDRGSVTDGFSLSLGSCKNDPAAATDSRVCLTKSLVDESGRHGGTIAVDYLPSISLLLDRAGLGNKIGSLYLVDLARKIFFNLNPPGSQGGERAEDAAFRQKLSELSSIPDTGDTAHFLDGGLYFTRVFDPCSRGFTWGDSVAGESKKAEQPGAENKVFLVAGIVPGYFTAEKQSAIRFLLAVSAALLVVSLAVCTWLAGSRNRVRMEEMQRVLELEENLRKQTRALDDSNLQLNAEIAERLSTEKRLKGANELLTVMLESIDGLIYVVDMDTYEILFVNEYVRRLFGFNPLGRSCFQFIHSNQGGPCSFCTNSKLLDEDGNPVEPIHWEYRNPFNKKWYSAKAQAILWSTGKYVRLEIAVDITEQKRLQHFLQEARRQAELAIGARSRFVALVAHDLKSPFFSMTQMLRRILERETFDYQVHREFLENIVENGHRMLQMIDNLLSLDRFETGEAKIERVFFDVSVMADEVLQNFRHPAFEKGIRLINSIQKNNILYADQVSLFHGAQ